MTRTSRPSGVAGSLLLLSLSLGACGEDDKKGESKDLTEGLEEFEPYKFSDLELPYETSEECVAHAESAREDTSARTECMCNECLDLMQECDVLEGCLEIRDCSETSGCTDEFTCYLSPVAPCTEVVDAWGNASLATTVSLELMKCSTQNACN